MPAPDFKLQLQTLAVPGQVRRRRTLDSHCGAVVRSDGRELINFCSNDYLGLAAHPELIAALQEGAAKFGAGAGASHLLSGHLTPHHQLELRLAAFTRLPRALYFSTGYMANLGIIPALAGRGDAIFSDTLNHASLIDGARLSRAEIVRFAHRDCTALATSLAASRSGRKLIITDAVFSMDGDLAPLPQMLDLCEHHDAWLMVDDAHGFGVLGAQGRGSLAHYGLRSPRLIYMATLGKAAGVFGAFVAAESSLIEWLLQRARTYIFTTAAPPALAHALLTSLRLIEQGDDLRANLNVRIQQLRSALKLKRWRLLDSPTAVQAVVIGGNEETLRVAEALYAQGLWAPAIRPPTVAEGSSRLRISLCATHTQQQVHQLAEAILKLEQQTVSQ